MQKHLPQHPKRIETVHAETLEGELCLYDWQRLKVHNLNPTAARVWELCDGQTTPQEMAAQLHGDLTTEQAEELVWLTLKRLEQAHLLDERNKVVRPGGHKVYTRREMLAKLGVAAVMLPVVSSIVAPGPVAAQSPGGGAPATEIVMYNAGNVHGNIGGRAGADAACQAHANAPAGYTNYRAFISVAAGDAIADMPGNYAVPTNVPIVSTGGTTVANNWADLLDGSISASLNAAGVGNGTWGWYSGSNDDGTLAANRCDGGGGPWTSNAGGDVAQSGNQNSVGADWLESTPNVGCASGLGLMCIAY